MLIYCSAVAATLRSFLGAWAAPRRSNCLIMPVFTEHNKFIPLLYRVNRALLTTITALSCGRNTIATMNTNDPRQVSRAARLMMDLKLKGNIRNDLRDQFNQLVADIIAGKVRRLSHVGATTTVP